MGNVYPADWNHTILRHHAPKIGSGITPTGGSRVYVTSGVPLIRSQNVLHGALDLSDVVYISDMQHQKMANSRIVPLDVLLNITGASIGRSCVVPDNLVEANVNQHVCIIRPADDLDAAFLCSFLNSDIGQKQIDQFQAGGNRQGLNYEQIGMFRIPLPPLPEQRAIAAILSTWDEAITLTTRLIDALKRRKQALMQLLLTGEVRFAEFDGEWETLPLGKIANVKRGASPRPINDPQWFSETGRAWVRIADINASPTRFLNQASQYLSSLGEALSVKAEVGDLILSIAATIGVPKIVNIPACIHDGFVLITGYSDTTNGDFLYHYLSMLTSLLASGGQPGTQKNINSELVREIEIPTPDIPEQQKIADVLTIADEEILYWSSIAESLTKQKRGLMQQLLTGTVRVQVGER